MSINGTWIAQAVVSSNLVASMLADQLFIEKGTS